jgi:O-antigen/teichoic acid export membrane protein
MKEVIHGAMNAFMLKAIGAFLAFILNVAIARLLGADGTGVYFLALSVSVIGSVIGRIGLDRTLLRFISAHATKEEWGQLYSVQQLGFRLALTASFAVTVILFLSSSFIADYIYGKPELEWPIRWMSLSIMPYALLNLEAESFKGLKKIRIAMVVQGILVPLLALLTIYFLARQYQVLGVIYSYLLATSVTALYGGWKWWKLVRKWRSSEKAAFSKIWVSCRKLYVVEIINMAIIPWAPVFILGIWLSTSDVGIYGAAVRITMLLNFFLIAVNNVVSPKFSELYTQEKMDKLAMVSKRTALLILLMASPFILILTFGSEYVMALYGPDFRDGSTILAIMTVGAFFNIACGSVNILLIMSGNEKDVMNTLIASVVLMVVLLVVLVPLWGLLGAAIAYSVTVIIRNLAATWYVKKRLGFMPLPVGSS